MRKPITKRATAGKTQPKAAAPAARTASPTPEDKPSAAAVKEKAREKPAKAASKGRTEPLNFRVTADLRRAFKRAAAAQDCKKVELLERIFTEWSARNPA